MMQLAFDSTDLCAEALFYPLFAEAERTRWRSADIRWEALEREKVSPALLAFVRQAAFAEMTTYSATRRFLSEFSDDVDFTQWISVWFYEESTHPQILMQWLHALGDRCSARDVRRARLSTPFMRSRFGTLVTNVISETVASHNYLTLHRGCAEPVLASIAKHLATDEARHAQGFFAYAKRMLERSPYPDLERMDALKVLHSWFREVASVTHPVSEFVQRTAGHGFADAEIDSELPARHACRLIGTLIGRRIESVESVRDHLSELRGRLELVEGEPEAHAAP